MTTPVFEILAEANLQDSHWGQRLICAEANGYTTFKDMQDAGGWATCACGKQDTRIPRYPPSLGYKIGPPKDDQLRKLGYDFCNEIEEAWGGRVATKAIQVNAIRKAARILVAIEKRAREILADF